ncbi:hypothetical protein [Liquorilactobacillus satsumensis]|uniref:hypothetical protein n=2 Tax=Lactobacillaceae TaxID=33958 RepID=UPI0039ED53B2
MVLSEKFNMGTKTFFNFNLFAGIDSIEHGFYVNDEEIELMLEHNTYLTPILLADTFENLSVAYQQGAKFTCGTDAGRPFNGYDKTCMNLNC